MKAIVYVIMLTAIGVSQIGYATPFDDLERVVINDDGTKELKEYRFKKTSGRLLFEMSRVRIEGYDGEEVIIYREVEKKGVDERALGLQGISGSGLRDNTGLGISVMEKDDLTEVRLVNFNIHDSIRISVPRQLSVSILGGLNSSHGNLSIENLNGELEVTSTWGDVKLNNVTGPMTIKTVQGDIEAKFATSVKGPVSIHSTLGFVDVALPKATQADLQMGTTMGELYAAEEFNIEVSAPKNRTADAGGVNGVMDFRNVVGVGTVTSSDTTKRTFFTGHAVYVDTDVDSLASRGALTVAREKLNEIQISSRNTANRRLAEVLDSNNLSVSSPKYMVRSGPLRVGSNVYGTINGGGEDIILRTNQGNIYLRTLEQ